MKLIQLVKREYRKSRQKRWNALFDKKINEKAEAALANLAKQGKSISPSQLKACNDYAQDVLGSKAFSPWLQVYTTFRGEFLEGWIPDNYMGRVISPGLNGHFENLSVYKTLSKRILETDLMPDLAYFVKGSWVLVSGEPVSLNEVKSACFEDYPFVFIKRDFSFQGNGVIKLSPDDFDEFDFGSFGDSVIQAPIFQHSILNELSPNAVATIRITTLKQQGKQAKNILSGLRVGQKGMDIIDSKSSIRVPIFLESGEFYSKGITAEWETLESHPESGIKFKGKSIPFYSKIVKSCEQLHNRIPHLQLIGWDVSVTDSGEIKLIEWNTGHPGIIYTEPTTGPSFKGLGWENLWKKM
ncbi:sugar-transfer associated ATP-grasp domain-containing protein [Algoriphagus formosus]|uniref:Alpha-L-glutamate ligase-related protein ATP-grasp domain-containing protein n=1 Tax=Algoriphagus formosus TaxID=2007308 RepID=A0A4R5V412_9BACT|nr:MULTISPECIES: sugar-transfer associated ATP-grasp domain-containing protein [Algoriphagus]TDK46599.1 hypothetical protein E1898_06015 [Algoriphagus aquimaris]